MANHTNLLTEYLNRNDFTLFGTNMNELSLQVLALHSPQRRGAELSAGGANGIPQSVLDGWPREELTDRSSLLKEATLTLVVAGAAACGFGQHHDEDETATTQTTTTTTHLVLAVIPAEFGAIDANLQNARLVVQDETQVLSWLALLMVLLLLLKEGRKANNDNDRDDDYCLKDAVLVVVLRPRGELSFAQTARAAQQRGALGLVILVEEDDGVVVPSMSWPHHGMAPDDDSTTQHGAHNNNNIDDDDITIPVVIVPPGTSFPPNAVAAAASTKVSLTIRENTDLVCSICTESFRHNTTTILLPPCRHRFHEACAVTWLSRHNSWPYCRSSVDTNIAGPSPITT